MGSIAFLWGVLHSYGDYCISNRISLATPSSLTTPSSLQISLTTPSSPPPAHSKIPDYFPIICRLFVNHLPSRSLSDYSPIIYRLFADYLFPIICHLTKKNLILPMKNVFFSLKYQKNSMFLMTFSENVLKNTQIINENGFRLFDTFPII